MRLWPFRSKRSRAIAWATDPHYSWPLEDVLLHWGKKDPFRLRDAMAGILVLGAIGSGKSTGSGQCIALSMLRAGYGFLVLCAKPDEALVWERYCRMTGRQSDLIRFTADGSWRFSPLDYELNRQGGGSGQCENIVNLLFELLEFGDRDGNSGGGGQGDGDFFKKAVRQVLRNLVDLIIIAKGRVTVPDLYKLLSSAPRSPAERSSTTWQDNSFCYACLCEAQEKEKTPRQMHDFELVKDYFLDEFPILDGRTRTNIVASFTSMVDLLNRGLLRELFCTDTNITPTVVEQGAVLVIDLPVREYGDVGLYAAILWKFCFQKSI